MAKLTFQLKTPTRNKQGSDPYFALYGLEDNGPEVKFVYKCSGPKFPSEIFPARYLDGIPGNPFNGDETDAE